MRALGVLAVALVLGFAGPAAAGDTTAPPAAELRMTPEKAAAALAEAIQRARNNDAPGIIVALRPVVGSPAFAALTEVQRYWVCVLLGNALYETRDYAGALLLLRQATEFRQASGNDWRMRFWAALAAENHTDAIGSMTTLSRRWPDVLNSISNRVMFDLQRQVQDLPKRDALLVEMLTALHRARYQPDPFVDNSPRWRSLTQLLIAEGQLDEARRVAAEIRAPLVIAEMMMDRRLDATMEGGASADFAVLFETELARMRELSTENPNLLEGVNNLALALIRLDRGEEALALLDAAIERTRAGTASKTFGDQSEHLNWTRNNRAYALLSLGRGEDAVAEMRRGARLPESGHINISQTFNLANMLLRLGRNREVLETLAEVDLNYSSPYGWMVAHHALACAQVELGRRAEADALLVQMRARGDASRTILRETELCFGHIEEAAALYLRDLEDADERGPALLSAQTFRLPRHQTPFDARMSERWRSVLARADVRAALERHGRVLALPVLESQY